MRVRQGIGAFLFLCGVLHAQISPGELSEAHKDLEGIGNCTQCHTMGKTLSNENCLNCHTEIRDRQNANKGFHAPLRSKQCVECHKEHHGRNFRIVRFSKESFDHALTGYRLEGKHAAAACEQCHTRERITAKDIAVFPDARKQRTMLGLGTACLSCHKDEHRGQFNRECTQCHTMNGWKPASKFSHASARFPLEGAHATAACSGCHTRGSEPNAPVKFARLEFASCRSCHADPHKGKFTQECAQCHTPRSWHSVKTSLFDHAATQFPLAGKHAVLRCEQCHPKDKRMKNPSGETGFHITRFRACTNCHGDAHARQFAGRTDRGECSACHTEQSFTHTTYSLSDHRNSRFPLTGAHQAVPCVKCHVGGKVQANSTRQFRWERPQECTTCHTDVHRGQFAGRMTENGCMTCHTTGAWDELTFSHAETTFPLKGRHAAVACAKCHTVKDGVPQYSGVKKDCSACHTDTHAGQFAGTEGTDCARCHTEQGWRSLVFDHNTQAKFALTGKHENVRCDKCHREALINSVRTIKYKPMEAACIDCHPAQ
ncbi:MAG: cytochrome C [Bacteroidetes bacterium]|nr:cytochrome C [Bacteroidota bacterium]